MEFPNKTPANRRKVEGVSDFVILEVGWRHDFSTLRQIQATCFCCEVPLEDEAWE
jgi:hypothetical protein